MNAPLQTEEILRIPIAQIDDSPFQKARVSDRGNLDELADSIKNVGVQQPAVVRCVQAGRYELVAGHRRKRASELAGVDDLPCVSRALTDDQVLEIQLVENSQREDVHPLDEADNFAELVKRGKTPAQIADKIGRTHAYVVQRLALCKLTKAVRKALEQDKIVLGVAMVIARIPSEQQQDEALKMLTRSGGHVSVGYARQVIQEQFMLLLKDAPFKIDDAELLPKAGACTTCEKRTGNQRELFSDIKSADICTDQACYRAKLDAFWKIRAKEAKDSGQRVLEGKAAAKALEQRYGGELVRVDDTVYGKGYKSVEVKSLIKKAGLPVTIAQDPKTGQHVELVPRKDAEKAAGKAPERSESRGGSASRERKAQIAKERKRKRLIELALGLAVAAAEKSTKLDQLVDIILRGFIERALHDDQVAILARRDIEPEKRKGGYAVQKDYSGALTKLFNGMTPAQKRGLGVELALHMFAPSNWSPAKQGWGTMLKSLGVDVDKVQKQVDAEERERAAAKAAKSPKAPKASKSKPTKKKKGKRS